MGQQSGGGRKYEVSPRYVSQKSGLLPCAGRADASRPIIEKYTEHIYFGFGWQAGLTSSIIAEYTATKIKDKKFHSPRRPAR